ncbi:MAG: hypothetical protein M3114_07365 [Thermoproteota archaeon]|nr:hypothetical protein [Thermoproteota archaeon]
MTDQFAFLEDKRKAAIAVAMSLGVLLLLLPASLRFGSGGTIIIQEAFGQLTSPPLGGGEEDVEGEEEEEITTLPANASMFLLRGFIGSSLSAQGGDIPTDNSSSHIVTGRYRVFANESLVERFVAEMNLAAIDGTTTINETAFHNITIEETTPHRFELTEIENGVNTTTATGSIPPVSSNLMTRIYVNGNTTPVIDNVPLTISIRSQVLVIEGIDIDETMITDPRQRDLLSIIDGQTIYGTIPRR